MSPTTLRWTRACLYILLLTCAKAVYAEDRPTGWKDIRDRLAQSDDPAHRKMVARWDKAIAPQNWASANGKNVRARWNDYFDESKTVQLIVMDGNKEPNSYMVPLDKLAKPSQAHVTQILKLLKELDDAGRPLRLLDSQKNPNGSATSVLGPAKDPRPPLKPGEKFYNSTWFPDKAKWRTDYEEFRKSIGAVAIDTANAKWELRYGQITPLWKLKEFNDRLNAANLLANSNDITHDNQQEIHDKIKRYAPGLPIGDFMWECTLTSNTLLGSHNMNNPAIVSHYTDLAPLAEPFQLHFTVNEKSDYGKANLEKKLEKLPAKIRFIGTLEEPMKRALGVDDLLIKLTIRFPDDQPKE